MKMKKLSFETVECLKQQVATTALMDYCGKNDFSIIDEYNKAQPMHIRVRMGAGLMRSSLNCYAVIADKAQSRYIIVFDLYEGNIAQFNWSEFDEGINVQLSREETLRRQSRNEYVALQDSFYIADVLVTKKIVDGWIVYEPVPQKKSK